MRFDDSLATVLAADTATDFGAQSAWRQLVDLIARRRVPDLAEAVGRLRALREQVPDAVRAASGRALAWGEPPAALVSFFAEEELAVAAPVLRTATLTAREWAALLPRLTPAQRAVLRHRRDLPGEVERALGSFGATDFVLDHEGALAVAPPAPIHEPAAPQPPVQSTGTPFVTLGEAARALPVVAAAMRHAQDPSRSQIADLVARIDAFRRDKPVATTPLASATSEPPENFRFETDAAGVIRWVDGVARGPLIGLTLAHSALQGVAQVDAAARGALRTRSTFRDVRLEVAGDSAAAGSWRLSGVPRFEPLSGRFEGLSGTARRPRREEAVAAPATASDALRQLVHELRTPANAIAGFSELIGTELLGPVPIVYRDRAQLIQRQAAALVAAIDDLDTAARIEGSALELRPDALDLGVLLSRIAADLRPLAIQRGATLIVDSEQGALVHADDRAVARLLDRLLTTALAVAEPGERLRAQLAVKTRTVRLHVTRPQSLTATGDDALLAIDTDVELVDGPLLGTGFTLRLVSNLATALGGSFTVAADRLTLRLPAAQSSGMERTASQ
ncbi:HAMP domain-containing sensor histidine kinase [Sphingomonas sp.]|uniref:sensor histidine kinase n=1 Tax=Sphingomonas sp. TaxID=28214 RepID=UPI002D80EF76|nr:HAMP domain-containing sensor histidine kinase [Sphingomonas sp.]HEU0044681.1 HAMP domain-containing sensor histidine kinase [Sphingomonas sp.]